MCITPDEYLVERQAMFVKRQRTLRDFNYPLNGCCDFVCGSIDHNYIRNMVGPYMFS